MRALLVVGMLVATTLAAGAAEQCKTPQHVLGQRYADAHWDFIHTPDHHPQLRERSAALRAAADDYFLCNPGLGWTLAGALPPEPNTTAVATTGKQ